MTSEGQSVAAKRLTNRYKGARTISCLSHGQSLGAEYLRQAGIL
jgi:hypothetical protein